MQLAQNLILPGNDVTGAPISIGLSGPVSQFGSLGDIITKALPVLLTFAGLILFLYFIWGGYDYLMSGGDAGKMDAGKQKITNALIGFGIIFISFFLTQMISFIFGVSFF